MTVDIRAKVICDLGEVISGGWSDDHVQGTGLIRTRGELVLRGLIQVGYGRRVQLAYVKDGLAVRFPRSLRVLSSFPDPFRRQTTLQLGCLLTLREDSDVPEDDPPVTSWDDPINTNVSCTLFLQLSNPLTAEFAAKQAALRTGINLPPEGIELNNSFAKDKFNYDKSYVRSLSDLLVSENRVGYLDASETLRIVNLRLGKGGHRVIKQERIIDVSPVNSGKLPATKVESEYEYQELKQPESEEPQADPEVIRRASWEQDETVGPSTTITIDYEGGTYRKTFTPRTSVVTRYDEFDRVIERVETVTSDVAAENPSYIRWYLNNPVQRINDGPITRRVRTVFTYARKASEIPPDSLFEVDALPAGACGVGLDPLLGSQGFNPERDSKLIRQVTTTLESDMAIAGKLNIAQYSGRLGVTAQQEEEGEQGGPAWFYQPSKDASVITETVEIEYETDEDSGITKTITKRLQASALTQQGQQLSAEESETAVLQGAVAGVVARGKRLVNLGSTVNTVRDRVFGLQTRPGFSDRKNERNRKRVIAQGTVTNYNFVDEQGNTVEKYRPPYVSDSQITIGSDGRATYSPSDARVQARSYAETQNNLAFGHRNGFSLLLSAQDVPTYPLENFTINAENNTAAYKANGISWSFDSNGIVCNVDALFRGGVGSTGSPAFLWFPVAPGVTLLGPAPAVFQNPDPKPANSLPVDANFDPLDPPSTFWDDDLPFDTPAVPEEEINVDVLVPFAQLEKLELFTSRTVLVVQRGLVNIPQVTDVLLRVRTRVSVFVNEGRNVVLPTRTRLLVARSPVAIREALTECFTITGFNVITFRA